MKTVAEVSLPVQEPGPPSDLLSLEERSYHCVDLAVPEQGESPCWASVWSKISIYLFIVDGYYSCYFILSNLHYDETNGIPT